MERKSADFSQFDLSENKLEIVEGEDGSKKLVVNKNLKNLVTKRVVDMEKGASKVGETIQIDFGHYIGSGIVKAYLGGGVYRVKEASGRVMDVPEKNIFTTNGGWR